MSIRVMTRVWDTSPYVGTQLLIELALADFANDEGECWPAMDRIAQKARCSVRYAREVVTAMEKAKRLAILEGGGRGRSNRYRLLPENPELGRTSETRNSDAETRNSATQTRNSDAETRNPGSPDPSVTVIDPSKEPSLAARKARTPYQLVLSDEQKASLREAVPAADLDGELTKFNDWLLATGRPFKDYIAAFRNWLRRSTEHGRTPPSQRPTRQGARPSATTAPDTGAWQNYANGG